MIYRCLEFQLKLYGVTIRGAAPQKNRLSWFSFNSKLPNLDM